MRRCGKRLKSVFEAIWSSDGGHMGRLSWKINDGRESGANYLEQAYCLVSLFVHHYGALGAFICLAFCLSFSSLGRITS